MFSIHHVSLSVKDIEKSKKFYSILGFSEVLMWDDPKGDLSIVHLKNGNTFLELFWYKNNTPAPESSLKLETDLPRIGVKHFGLKVESIEEAKSHLLKNNLAKDVIIKQGKTGISYFFIKDPDGILLEIVEDKRAFENEKN